MKYIKLYELFETDTYYYSKEINNDNHIAYKFNSGKYTYVVNFVKSNLCWTRLYGVMEKSNSLMLTNDNTTAVLNTVFEITEDFLFFNKVNYLMIQHEPTDNKDTQLVNKRARVNYNLLKNIKGYNLSYFYKKEGDKIKTICLLCKKGLIPTEILDYFDNNGIKKINYP